MILKSQRMHFILTIQWIDSNVFGFPGLKQYFIQISTRVFPYSIDAGMTSQLEIMLNGNSVSSRFDSKSIKQVEGK